MLSVVTKFAERGSASKRCVCAFCIHSRSTIRSADVTYCAPHLRMGYAEHGTSTTQAYGRFTFYGVLRQSFSATADVRCCTLPYGKLYRWTVLSASHLRLKVLAGSFHVSLLRDSPMPQTCVATLRHVLTAVSEYSVEHCTSIIKNLGGS